MSWLWNLLNIILGTGIATIPLYFRQSTIDKRVHRLQVEHNLHERYHHNRLFGEEDT